MSRRTAYLSMLMLPVLLACSHLLLADEKIDWRISLDHKSKTPYGTSLAYRSLPYYFPGARTEPLTKWFSYTSVDEQMHGRNDSPALLVMLGLDYYVTDDEWLNVLKFARAGNEVFILASRMSHRTLLSLGCEKMSGSLEEYPLTSFHDGRQYQRALRLLPDTTKAFGYTGRSIGSYFRLGARADPDTLFRIEDEEEESAAVSREARVVVASIDTPAIVLGMMAGGGPDFIRYRIGNGHVTLHAAPLVLSNYFLLQPGNKEYLDAIWHSFPANVSVVYWNEFFRRSPKRSNLSVLLQYPATRWALIIGSLTLLLYVLFGTKRMQRIVPVIPPIENASVSFVETVGRLYFNKGDHANLAEKMVQHFLEWVRTHYYLDTAQLNEEFARKLASKSGRSLPEVSAFIDRIHQIRLRSQPVSPEALHELYRYIQSFYKTR